MADCISQAAQAFLPQHIAGDPHNEEFVAAFAEHHFCGDASVGASQDGSKGNLRRHAPIAGAPAKSPWIKWDYAGLLTWVTRVGHFGKIAIALYQKSASLFRGPRHVMRRDLGRIETIDEFEHDLLVLGEDEYWHLGCNQHVHLLQTRFLTLKEQVKVRIVIRSGPSVPVGLWIS